MKKPNILVIMTDQQAPQFSGPYGHPVVKTPHLDRLAENGIVFENAYTPCPICVPARMSFMTGRHVCNNGTWDNGVPLPEETITWAHRLRAAGYRVALSGKMHFRGFDQLHGFEEQLAYDINGRNRPMPPDWREPPKQRPQPWTDLRRGVGETKELVADDAVEDAALEWLQDRAGDDEPWALSVGFVCPHAPFVCKQEHYDRYDGVEIDLPEIPQGHLASLHPHHRRNRESRGHPGELTFPEEIIRDTRRSYYALVSYIDDKVGRFVETLESTGQLENTVVVFTADHGEMMGEHGLWYKSNFYEQSARIPLIISNPARFDTGRRVPELVSCLDLAASLIAWSGAETVSDADDSVDGRDLTPLLTGEPPVWDNRVFSEYHANISIAPQGMVRRDHLKYNYYHGEEPELFDLAKDPGEFHNLAGSPEYASRENALHSELLGFLQPADLDPVIRESQARRHFLKPWLFSYLDEFDS